MVCDRCKTAVMRELNALGYHIDSLELGQVVLDQDAPVEISKLEKILQELGFELLIEETDVLVEEIKIAIINKIDCFFFKVSSVFFDICHMIKIE